MILPFFQGTFTWNEIGQYLCITSLIPFGVKSSAPIQRSPFCSLKNKRTGSEMERSFSSIPALFICTCWQCRVEWASLPGNVTLFETLAGFWKGLGADNEAIHSVSCELLKQARSWGDPSPQPTCDLVIRRKLFFQGLTIWFLQPKCLMLTMNATLLSGVNLAVFAMNCREHPVP